VPGYSRATRARHEGFAQHFLASPRLAAELVGAARIIRADRVVEFGAGTGVLTDALARQAAHVVAIELDPTLVARLARRFAAAPSVTVLHADAALVALPATPYRVMANLPFNQTATILRRLLDEPDTSLVRADLIVQWQVARARANASPGPPADLLGATWGPWWAFARGRRLPAALFRPAPTVDAAVLTITRQPADLLPIQDHAAYAAFVRHGFETSRLQPFLLTVFGARNATALRETLGLPAAYRPQDLNVGHWVSLFRARPERRRRGSPQA